MPNSLDIQYSLESSFVTALKAIFKNDPDFPFTEDQKTTGIIISTAFPEKDAEMKIPQMVISQIQYDFSMTSLSGNLYSDIMESGKIVGKRYLTIVPYALSIVCLGGKDGIASDIANLVLNYIWFEASEIFQDTLCLNITRINKSPGGPSRLVPSKAYSHTVSLSGSLNWCGDKVQTEETRNIIQSVRLEIIEEMKNI